MNLTCIVCGGALSTGRFCPACGAEQLAPPAEEADDPFLGKTIGERYEVLELINVGGMGRVYRGLHRTLDRAVAIKVIHPHLNRAEEITSRFMVEAQTASRLNHPNVVSIYDFGRTSPGAGGHLYLVMELLLGQDLATVLQSGVPMSLRRISGVLSQTLGALGEAHHLGITHRDVKPENIILEAKRSGADHIKVIDFGIAKFGGGHGLTQRGQVVGTPYYMVPEQATAQEVGPSADLYAVGVMLFEMLTGRLLFDGPTPNAIMLQHLAPSRPDPRHVAPERPIPDALAKVCLQAIDVDPAKRFPAAEDLARAIFDAIAPSEWTSHHASLFPSSSPSLRSPLAASSSQRTVVYTSQSEDVSRRASRAFAPTSQSSEPPVESDAAEPPDGRSGPVTPPGQDAPLAPNEASARGADAGPGSSGSPHAVAPDVESPLARSADGDASRPLSPALPSEDAEVPNVPARPRVSDVVPLLAKPQIAAIPQRFGMPLKGRTDDVAWGLEALESPENSALVFWGRPGSGRTRLLWELAAAAARAHLLVVHLHAPRPPQNELSFGGLRLIIARLVGLPIAHSLLASGAGATNTLEASGLQTIFGHARAAGSTGARRAAGAALCWAARCAVDAAGGPVLLAIDDVDHLDGISRAVLTDMLSHDRAPRLLRVITTSEAGPDDWSLGTARFRPITGLGSGDLIALLQEQSGLLEALDRSGWMPPGGDVEPLYVDQLLRWHAEEVVHQEPPARLANLIEWRIRNLPAAQRRALQTVAVHGAGAASALAAAAARPEDFDEAASLLVEAGFIEWDPLAPGMLRLSHPIFGAIALNIAPRGAVTELQARAADALASNPLFVELQAYHALRGRTDLESFMLVEESARLRQQNGDEDGAIAALGGGLQAARAGVLRGESESTSGLIIFGRKLGAALVHAGRLDEAMGVLMETLDVVGPHDIERALLLEQVAVVAESRNRHGEGESRRREAIGIAERLGNRALIEQLRRSSGRSATGPRTLQEAQGTQPMDESDEAARS